MSILVAVPKVKVSRRAQRAAHASRHWRRSLSECCPSHGPVQAVQQRCLEMPWQPLEP
eukprot:COSAG05_NODE_16478_length_345_cov_0.768293_1_plen_57_part_10